MFEKKNIKQLTIGIFCSVIAAPIIWFLQKTLELEPWKLSTLILTLITLIAIMLLIKCLSLRSSIKQLANPLSPLILHKNSKPSLLDQIDDCNNSFLFLGISSKRTMSTPELQTKLIEIGRKKGEIKILLLNPQSPQLLLRASDEDEVPAAWTFEIQATIDRLKGLATREDIAINIRLYNRYPVWRMTVIDRTKSYIHFFLKGQQGPQSELLELTDDNDLFQAFLLEFDQIWDESDVA